MNPTGSSPGSPPEKITSSQLAPAENIHVPPPLSPKLHTASRLSVEFSGPMPPPELLRQYEIVCPGSADRILKMAEQEAAHRHETEKTIVNAQIQHSHRQFLEARFGQLCALVITLAALGGGVSTALQGHEIAGGVIGVGGIGGIVTTFILGRARSKPEQKPPPKSDEQKSKGTKQKKR